MYFVYFWPPVAENQRFRWIIIRSSIPTLVDPPPKRDWGTVNEEKG
jgi:hypothetical protein